MNRLDDGMFPCNFGVAVSLLVEVQISSKTADLRSLLSRSRMEIDAG